MHVTIMQGISAFKVTIIYSLWVLFVGLFAEGNGLCPTFCRCYNRVDLHGSIGYSVECVGQNLTTVPVNLPINATHLYLSKNNVIELSDGDFIAYNQIRVIDLSFNRISRISLQSLSSLRKLQALYLNDNCLTMAQDSMPATIFDNLVSLKILRLRNNNVSIKSYRDDLYVKLTSLETLSIDGVCDHNIEFQEGFKGLRSLTTLEIYGRLCAITNKTFENLIGLPINKLVFKTESNLTSLAPESFAYFPNLIVLDLSLNYAITEIVKTGDAWYGLRNTTIKTLILTQIRSYDTSIVDIPITFFKYLNETRIETLLLNRNNIRIFWPGISQHLPFLKYWDMSYNQLASVGSLMDEMRCMTEVIYIDCSRQQNQYEGPVAGKDLMQIPETWLAEQHHVKSREIFKRSVTPNQAEKCRSQVFMAKSCPDVLPDCNNIPIRALLPGDPWCIHFPPKLETFNLSASLRVDIFRNILPRINGFGGPSLRETIYSFNRIKYLTGPIVIHNPNPNISYSVDLSDNNMECIFEEFMSLSVNNGLKLTNLYLSRNDLGQQLKEDTNGNLFQHYPDISELRLDSNHIQILPPAVFRSLYNLVTLNLSKNSLVSLDFEFKHMTKLQVLDLSYNSFTNIDDNSLSNMNVLIKSTNFSLNLFENPIGCTCQTLNLLHWMRSNAVHVSRLDNYICLYKNTHVKLTEIDISKLQKECSGLSTTTIIIVAVGVTVFAVVIGGLITAVLICRKGYVRVMKHSARNRATLRRGNLFAREGSGIIQDIEYKDAFVICAHEDDDWVLQLEENIGQSLSNNQSNLNTNIMPRFNFFIHKHDFIGGKVIFENIEIAIKTTRKKILVLSKHFVESDWCVYEFDRVLERDINNRMNSIIPIVFESLHEVQDKIPDNLRDLCSRTTYIEWPSCCANCNQVTEFWRKLSDALAE